MYPSENSKYNLLCISESFILNRRTLNADNSFIALMNIIYYPNNNISFINTS